MSRDKVTIDIEANFIGTKLTSGVNKAKKEIDGLSKSTSKTSQSIGDQMSQSSAKVDKLGDSLSKTKSQADKLGGTHAQPTVSLRDRASSTLEKMSSSLRSFTSKTWQVGVKILDYATAPLRGIKNLLFSMKSLVLAIGAGWATNKLIMNPINLADAYSGAKIGFSTLFGEKEGQAMMDKIDKFAKETPFKTSGVISNVQKMMAYGWDASRIMSDMKVIGDAAAATGKGDEGLASIVYALSEIKSKGKLSTQELNQLASAGIKAKAYLAEGLGFGTSDAGMKKLSEALEDGAIGANQAVDLILEGMKEFDGMMDRTANETVEGLKSQLEDVFEINIARKWGQGLQEGAKRGLGSIVELLDASEEGIKNVGAAVQSMGSELSNLAADKLENLIEKIMEVTSTSKFKNASLGGKIKILWDEVIAQPFSYWWDTKGEKYISEKMGSLGKGLGTTLSKGLLTILGVKGGGVVDDAASIGSSFAEGFLEGFDGDKVADALADAIERALKALFNGSKLSNILLAGLTINLLPGLLSAISSGINIYSGAKALFGSIAGKTEATTGLASFLGTASTASGSLTGSGAIGALAKFGSLLGSGAYSGAGLALAGGGAALGIAGAVAGLGSATKDFVKAANADYESDRKRSTSRGLTKVGMVGAGAAAGAAIGSVIPVVGTGVGALVGAGIGGLTAILSGNKVADSLTKITKSGKELKNINLNEHFGDITLSAKELQTKIKDTIGSDTIKRVDSYNSAVEALDSSIQSLNSKKTTMDFISFQTQNGVKMTDNMKSEYISAAQSIAETVQNYISTRNYAANSAVDLLFGGNKAGESLKSGFNKYYSTYTKDINEIGQKLNDALAKAIEDGELTINEQEKIDKLVAQLTRIQTEVEKKMAQQEFEAKIEGLKFDNGVGSGKMSASSFKALNSGLNEQLSTVVTANKDARDRLLQEIKTKYSNTVGGVAAGEGRKETDSVKKQYLETTAGLVINVTDVSLQGLSDAYGKEMNTFQEKLSSSFDPKAGKSITEQFTGMVNSLSNNATTFIERTYGISESTQKAMKELVKTMQPQKEQLEEIKKGYEQLGLEVPSTIQSALDDINFAEAMSGNVNSMYSVWAASIANSPHKEKILKAINSEAVKIPNELEEAILAACNKKVITPSVPISATLSPTKSLDSIASGFRSSIVESIRNRFTSPISVTQSVNVSVSKTATGNIVEGSSGIPYSDSYLAKNGYKRDKNGKIVKKANGGFIYDRMLSWIGEDGPEVVIPLGSNRRKRGIDLWKKAGQMMGIGNNAEGGAYGNPSAIGRLMENSGSTATPTASPQNTDSKVNVEVGGITIQVNDNGSGNLAQMIQEQSEEIKDTLCSILADAVDDGFKNVPLATS